MLSFCFDGPFLYFVLVKPSAPTLSVPNEIIEGLPTRYNFTCEADVGYPHGELVFKMRLHNETDFKALSFVDEIIEEERNCSKVSTFICFSITRPILINFPFIPKGNLKF